MRIYQVLGTVTLNQHLPQLDGARLKLAVPLSLDEIEGNTPWGGDSAVIWDDLGAGLSSRIAVSEGSEAAQPFLPDVKPIDAYCAAILDEIDIEHRPESKS